MLDFNMSNLVNAFARIPVCTNAPSWWRIHTKSEFPNLRLYAVLLSTIVAHVFLVLKRQHAGASATLTFFDTQRTVPRGRCLTGLQVAKLSAATPEECQ